MVLAYDADSDEYVVEFDVFHNQQTCHAAQLFPLLDKGEMTESGAAEEESVAGKREEKRGKLQKLSSIEKTRVRVTTGKRGGVFVWC